MTNYVYNREAADLVRKHLEDHDIQFFFIEEIGVFRFDMGITSRLTTISYYIHIDGSGIMILSSCPISANPEDKKRMSKLAEFLTRVNYDLTAGNFEMDYEDGEIRYRYYINTEGALPCDQCIEDGIVTGIYLFEKIDEGLLGIIFNDMSVKEAYKYFNFPKHRQIVRKIYERALQQGEDSEMLSYLKSILDKDEPDDEKPSGELN